MEPKIKETLEKQLQLLSECSKDATPNEMGAISEAMVQIVRLLNCNETSCPFGYYCRSRGCDDECTVTFKRFVTGQEEVRVYGELEGTQIAQANDTEQSDYYKCGLKKWSKTPLLSRISLIVSLLAVIMNLLVRCKVT